MEHSDYVAFILPGDNYNRKSSIPGIKLFKSYMLPEVKYSGVKLKCCFNIYCRGDEEKKQLRRRTSAPDRSFRKNAGASLPVYEEILRHFAAGVCDFSASGRRGLPAAAYGTGGLHDCIRCRFSQFVILPPLFSAEVRNDSPEISCPFPDHAALIRSRKELPAGKSGRLRVVPAGGGRDVLDQLQRFGSSSERVLTEPSPRSTSQSSF